MPTKKTTPKFKIFIFKDEGGTFAWHVKSRNGNIVCSGFGYNTKQAAIRTVRSVKENLINAPIEL